MSDFKKYYNWGWEVGILLKAIPKVILGAFIFAGLVKKKGGTHYLVLPSKLGDSILALSYLSEYKRQKNISHITVVCTPNYIQRLCSYYPDTVDDIICKEKWKIGALQGFVHTLTGEYLSMRYLDRVTFAFLTCNVSRRVLWDNPSISFASYAKTILYKISLSSQPERPQIPVIDLSNYIKKYDIKKGKTVFINPVAYSVQCDIKELLETVTLYLKSKGYQVITLIANDANQPIRETQAICCNLEEAFSLIGYGGILLGLRSGFMDVMAFANCKIITIDDDKYGYKSFSRMEKLGVNSDCHTIIYNGDNEAALQKVIAIMG